MPVTKEQMNYNEVAASLGETPPQGGYGDAEKDYIYNYVVTNTKNATLQQRYPSGTRPTEDEVNVAVLEAYPDGHQALGLDEPLADQSRAVSVEGYQEYINETQTVIDDEVEATDIISTYTSEIKKNKYKYPDYQDVSKMALNSQLKLTLENANVYTLGDLRKYTPPEQTQNEIDETKAATDGAMAAIVDTFVDATDGAITGLSRAASSAATFNDAIYRQTSLFFSNINEDDPVKKALNEYEIMNAKTTFDILKDKYDPSDIIEGDVDTLAGQVISVAVPVVADIALSSVLTAIPGGQVYAAKKVVTASNNVRNYVTKTNIASDVARLQTKIIGTSQTAQVGGQMIQDYRSTVPKGELRSREELGLLALSPALGAIETIPAKLVLKADTSKMITSLDKALGGTFSKFLGRIGDKLPMSAKIKSTTGTLANLTGESLIGAASEVTSEMAQNLIASDIVAYDEERALFSGTKEAGELGFYAQFFLNGVFKAKGALSVRKLKGETVSERVERPEEITEIQRENLKSKESIYIDGDGNRTVTFPESGLEVITDLQNVYDKQLKQEGDDLIALNNDINSDFILPKGTKVFLEINGYSAKNGTTLLEGFPTAKEAVDQLTWAIDGNISKTQDNFGITVERGETIYDNAVEFRLKNRKLDIENNVKALRDTGATIYEVGEDFIKAGYMSKVPLTFRANKSKLEILQDGENLPYVGQRVNYLSRQGVPDVQKPTLEDVQEYYRNKGFESVTDNSFDRENMTVEFEETDLGVQVEIFNNLDSVTTVEVTDKNGVNNLDIYSDMNKSVKDINTKVVENNFADKDIMKDTTGINVDDIDYGNEADSESESFAKFQNEEATVDQQQVLARRIGHDPSVIETTATGGTDVGVQNTDIEYRTRDVLDEAKKREIQGDLVDQFTRLDRKVDEDNVEARLDETPFDLEELDPYLNSLPQDVKDSIELTEVEGNPAQMNGGYGIFDITNRKIVIDTRYPLEEVIKTIAHETQHLGTSYWAGRNKDFKNSEGATVPAMTKMYDTFYNLNKEDIESRFKDYIGDREITEAVRYELVNEYFADLGIDTSVDNFLVRTKEFSGLSVEKVEAINKALQEGKRSLTVDLRTRSEDMTQEQADAFATAILSAQTQSTTLRNFNVELVYEAGSDVRKFIVTPTNYGTRTVDQVFNDESERWRKIRKRTRLDLGNNVGLSTKFVRSFIDNVTLTDGMLGVKLKRQVLSGVLSKDTVAAKNLLPYLKAQNEVLAFMTDQGITGQMVSAEGNSYEKTFKKFLKDPTPKQLQLAKDADRMLGETLFTKNQNVRALQVYKDDTIKFIADRVKFEQDNGTRVFQENYVNLVKAAITKDFARFNSEWETRMYNAFRDEDRDNLDRMLAALSTDPNPPNLKEAAREAKEKLKTEKDLSKRRSLQNDINLDVRLDALRRAIELSAQKRTGRTKITTNAIDKGASEYITRTLGNTDGISSARTANSYKSRKLDLDDEIDALYAQFLDPVVDPLQIAIGNVLNQNEVLHQYFTSNNLAKTLLSQGMAEMKDNIPKRLRGEPRETLAGGLIPILDSSLLKFIDIDSAASYAIDSMVQSAMSGQDIVLNKAIGLIKKSLTVRNPVTSASNLLSSQTQSLYNGVLFWRAPDFNLKTFDGKGNLNRRNFLQSFVTKSGKNNLSEVEKTLMFEIEKYLLPQVTPAQFDTFLPTFKGNPKLLKRSVTKTLEFMDDLLPYDVSPELTSDTISKTASHVLDKQVELYALSDDIPKIQSYFYNREIATAKYELIHKGITDPTLFREAVLRDAIPEAVDRTLRENTDLAAGPAISRSNNLLALLVRQSFITHPLQQAKIMSENVKLLGEDKGQIEIYRNDPSPEAQTYVTLLEKRQRSRLLGMSLGAASMSLKVGKNVGVAALPFWGLTSLYNYLAFMLSDDDELDKLPEDRTTMSPKETRAYTGLMKYVASWDGSAVDAPMPIRNGNTVYSLQDSSMDLTITFEPIVRRMVQGNYKEVASEILQLIFAKENNIPRNILNTFTDESLTTYQKGLELTSKVGGYLSTPFERPYSAITGKKFNGEEVSRALQVLNLGGIRVKEHDLEKETGYISGKLNRFKSDESVKDMTDLLKSETRISDNQLENVMSKVLIEAEASYQWGDEYLTRMYDLGYDKSTMKKWLESPQSGLSKSDVNKYINRRNIYTDNINTKLNNLNKNFKSTGNVEKDRIMRDNINRARRLVR